MKRLLLIILCAIMALSLFSCKNKGGESAEGLKVDNTEKTLSVSFEALNGSYTYKLHYSSEDSAQFSYRSTLKSGGVKVYYEIGDKRDLIFENDGYPIEGVQEYLEGEGEISIIIEATDAVGGSIDIAIGS